MKGIVLLSHGPLAKGMYETTKWFMGEDIPQYTYLCLEASESPEGFDERIKEKIKEVETGEGVILIADLLGGTPFNRASLQIESDKTDLFAGMNLAMVLQLLGNRLSDNYDFDELENVAKQGVSYFRPSADGPTDEDFFI